MFLNCCKKSTITKTQQKPKEVTDNEKWAEPSLWRGGLAGSQLYCCLGGNGNFLGERCRALNRQSCGALEGRPIQPKITKTHQAGARPQEKGPCPPPQHVTVGNVTEQWKTHEVNLTNYHECFQWLCKWCTFFITVENGNSKIRNTCLTGASMAQVPCPAHQSPRRCAQANIAEFATVGTLGPHCSPGLAKVTLWRDAPQHIHALLWTALNYVECNPALYPTSYSCSAYALLHHPLISKWRTQLQKQVRHRVQAAQYPRLEWK